MAGLFVRDPLARGSLPGPMRDNDRTAMRFAEPAFAILMTAVFAALVAWHRADRRAGGIAGDARPLRGVRGKVRAMRWLAIVGAGAGALLAWRDLIGP